MATTQNGYTDKTKDQRRIKWNCATEADLNWANKILVLLIPHLSLSINENNENVKTKFSKKIP